MKTLVRSLVVTLAFAGFLAPSMTAKTTNAKRVQAKSYIAAGIPTPLCVPSDPSYCGMR